LENFSQLCPEGHQIREVQQEMATLMNDHPGTETLGISGTSAGVARRTPRPNPQEIGDYYLQIVSIFWKSCPAPEKCIQI
jgi:hypothetical protein